MELHAATHLTSALDAEPVAAAPVETTAAPLKSEKQTLPRRKGGRAKDAIWDETTILVDKSVVCNHCHAVIHRYGCAKVERVRAHFQLRCLASRSADDSANSTASSSSTTSKRQKTERNDNCSNVGRASSSLLRPTPASAQAATRVSAAAAKATRRANYVAKATLFKRKVAQWVYATAQSFHTVEHELFVRAVRMLRADMPLPTPTELAGELLDLEATDSAASVRAVLAGKACCLAVEHWRDATGAHHVNYAAVCETVSYLLASSTVASAAKTLELSVDGVERVLARHERGVFYAIATPECAMLNPATRTHLQRAHPQCAFFYGCAYHALELLVLDLELVLPWLEATLASVRELLQTVYARPALQSQLPDLARLAACTMNDRGDVARTQRRTSIHAIVECFDAVVAAESALDAAVSRRDFVDADSLSEREALKRVQDFVLSETCSSDLARATRVLAPLQQQLQRYEASATATSRVTLADVYRGFVDLRETYSAMDCVSRKEKALLSSYIKERLGSIYGDAHGVAYVLDPLYLGANMDASTRHATERFIASYCHGLELASVESELAAYATRVRELETTDAAYWAMLARGDVRTFDFWTERRECPSQLQQLAWAVFSLPPTTTAPSRAFRAQCECVHARFHRTLSPAKLEQLALVHCNAASGSTADLSSLAPEPSLCRSSSAADGASAASVPASHPRRPSSPEV